MCKIFSCFTCWFTPFCGETAKMETSPSLIYAHKVGGLNEKRFKKSDIKEPLITESVNTPAIAESKIPFSKAEDNVDWRMYEDEVKPWDKEFSNIEYLKTLSQAKSLEKKLQGTYGSK
jgi:hypothetical protein